MFRNILTAVLLMSATVVAHADFKVGGGRATDEKEFVDVRVPAGTEMSAIRISVSDKTDIGRVYLAYADAKAPGLFGAFAKVNTTLHKGETTAWIALPKASAALTKIRVYANAWGDDSVSVGVFGK